MDTSLRIGSIFSGIGGLDLGLEMAGHKVIWQCEINLYCRRILKQHWPNTYLFKDVRTLTNDETFKKYKLGQAIDFLVGGDPCQENSAARTVRSCSSPSMGQDFIDIVRQIRPQFVLRENPSRARRDAPWPWHRFRLELERLGYGVMPFRLRSCCLGGNQLRDRLYLFGANTYTATRGWGSRFECSQYRAQKEGRLRSENYRYTNLPSSPGILRRNDGVPCAVDRVKALGNSVDVRQSYFIGQILKNWLTCIP